MYDESLKYFIVMLSNTFRVLKSSHRFAIYAYAYGGNFFVQLKNDNNLIRFFFT